MATVFELMEDPNFGLLPYLDSLYGDAFSAFRIQNYGFQPPGFLDPSKSRSGYRLRGMTGVNAMEKPTTCPLILGKIAPIPNPVGDSEEQIFKLGHQISFSIAEWGKCEAYGLSQWVDVNFEITKDQNRNVTSSRQEAWWWVMRWQFDLVGFFDVPT